MITLSDLPYEVLLMVIDYDWMNFPTEVLLNTNMRMTGEGKRIEARQLSVVKLQEWWRKTRLWTDHSGAHLTKKTLVRVYAVHYPLCYLINYARDLANKIRPDLLEVCDDFCGTRRKALEFLARPDITKENIYYTGW